MGQIDDLDTALRRAYAQIRERGHVLSKARAYFLWKRALGPGPLTTFVAASDGTVWRNDKVALLAELRIIMLRQGYPVGVLAMFDRHV